MELSIRNAELKDAEAITKLSGQLGYDSNNIATQSRLAKIFKSNSHCVFVAVENVKIIGWIHGFHSLRVESDSFVEIGGLVVDENYRKNGIGKMLVEQVIKWAESRSCIKIRVRCNTIKMESHRFYEAIGFNMHKSQKIFDKPLD